MGVERRGRTQRMRQEQTAAIRERQSFNWQQRCGWRRRCFSFACPVLYLGLCSHTRSASSVPPLPLPCLAAASAKNSCSDTRFSQEVGEEHGGRRRELGTGRSLICVFSQFTRGKSGGQHGSQTYKRMLSVYFHCERIQTPFL